MKETKFKPAVWRTSLDGLREAIGRVGSDGDEANSNDAQVGLLSFDKGLSLSLEVPFGTLIDREYIEFANGVRGYTGGYEDVDAVFGFSQDGKWYVLKDAYVSNWSESMPGFSSQRIEGNSLTVSNQPISNKLAIKSVAVQFDGFTKWFRNFNITRKYEMKKDEAGNYAGCEKVVYEYEPPESTTLFQNDNLSITVAQSGIEDGGPVINSKAALSVVSRLVISYAEPTELEEAVQTVVHQMRGLVALLTGVYCSVDEVKAFSPDEGLSVDYYAPFIKREHPVSNDEVMHMPFPFPIIQDKIPLVIERWFSLCPDAVNAATILVSCLDGSIMSVDLTFIACASALEALSRVGVNQERFTQEDFEANMAAALSSIEDGEFREWLGRITFNRKSAGSLARKLMNGLKPFSSYLIPDAERFLRDHRLCRNAYVHRDGLESDGVLKGEDLYYHTKAVWFLCYAAILNLIGISPEESLQAIEGSHYEDGAISQIRRQYAK